MKIWKQLVGLFFVLLIFDGALRKWVFPPSASLLVFALKDLMLWGSYLAYAWYRDPFALPRPVYSTWVPVLLGAYIFVVLLLAFIPSQPALTVAAVGLKSHLGYIPLVVLVPALISRITERKIERFLWGYLMLIQLPIFLLAIYQFSQPPGAWINQYVSETASVAQSGGFARITGTFSYIASFNTYIVFSAFLSASVIGVGIRWGEKKLQILGATLMAGVLVVIPMTVSRTPVFLAGGGLISLLLLTRFRKMSLQVLAVIVLVAFVFAEFGERRFLQGWEIWSQRTRSGGVEVVESRTGGLLTGPIDGIEDAGLVGYGVGTNHQAAPRVTGRSDWEGRYIGDRGTYRLFLELGALGWLVLFSLKCALLYIASRSLRQSRRPWEAILSATAFCVLLSYLFLPVVFNVVRSGIYWASAGSALGVWSRQQVRSETHSSTDRVRKTA